MSPSHIPPSVRDTKFHKLSQSEDESSSFALSFEDEAAHRGPGKTCCLFLASISILVITSFSFWLGTVWGSSASSSRTIDLNAITQYSPVLDDIPLSYKLTQFNGSLLKPNIFRGAAGPEVDAAWESLGVSYRPLIVPSALGQKSGLQPDQVKVSDKYGGGYPANLEGLHHLHCLNMLRQALWYNFDYYNTRGEGPFKNEPYILRMHVTHCLDILRQELMCTVDIGVLGQVWIHPKTPSPYVDFNTKHKCRDFDTIRRWAEERQVASPDQVPNDWLDPPKIGDRIYEEMP